MHLVIPVADEPRNPLLPLALESASRHAAWLSPVLVGSPLILDQYAESFPGLRVLPFPFQTPGDPIGNTTRMLRTALEDVLTSDPFVWSHDDIFFRGDVTLDDLYLEGATAKGSLNEVRAQGLHGLTAERTRLALESLYRPIWNYARHVPLVVNKTDMLRALEYPRTSPRNMQQNMTLDLPARIAPDVKIFKPQEVDSLEGPLFSTGNRFSASEVRRALGLALPTEAGEGEVGGREE